MKNHVKRTRSLLIAFALAAVASASFAQTPLSTADAKAAQAAGQAFGSAALTSGVTAPSNIANQGMAPGANNIMGASYTGVADPALMGLSTSPSMVTAGQTAKTASVNGFTSYSNVAADQGNQAAYFVTTTPIPITKISSKDAIAMVAAAPAMPTGIASSSTVVCHTTVANVPFDPSIDYMCNDTYNTYVTSCSLDKKVTISTTPSCDAAITGNTLSGVTHSPTITCSTPPTMVLNLGTIPGFQQCHGGGCNSDYYEYVMTIVKGAAQSSCKTLAINYKGSAWLSMCASYDGANTITVQPFNTGSYTYTYVAGGRNGGGYTVDPTINPGGVVTISGGHFLKPSVVNGADTNNCLSLNGLL